MARLMALCATRWPLNAAIAARFEDWPGDIGPSGASLPLRLAGALHALVLTGRAPDLMAVYPPHDAADPALETALRAALADHAAFVLDWVTSPPQTNEVRRAGPLLAVASWLAARFADRPLRLSELGASAGLNLMFDRFMLNLPDLKLGDPQSALCLTPDWQGPLPPVAPITVIDRRGVDLNPLDPANPDHALRLLAYLWPDQPDRIARTRAAITMASAPIDRDDAAPWLAARLADPLPGAIHLVYHTVAWQYFPAATQTAATSALQSAGASATPDAPLAWFGMEADRTAPGAALTLRLWPGDVTIPMGRADFHGRWVDWQAPTPM
jgi:hypothetical protein